VSGGLLYILSDFISGLSTIVSQAANATDFMALTMKHLFFRWLALKAMFRIEVLIALAVGVLTANFEYSAYVFCTLKHTQKRGSENGNKNCGPHKTTCRAKSDAIDEIITHRPPNPRDSPSETGLH